MWQASSAGLPAKLIAPKVAGCSCGAVQGDAVGFAAGVTDPEQAPKSRSLKAPRPVANAGHVLVVGVRMAVSGGLLPLRSPGASVSF
jgi:hypothetical protein